MATPTTRELLAEGDLLLERLERTAGGRPAGRLAGIRHEPPLEARQAADLGLALRAHAEEALGRQRPGGTPLGVARAYQLAMGYPVDLREVRRIKAYFDRHQGDRAARGFGDDDDPSPGYVAWLLWGGDAAWEWATRIVAENR